MFPIVVTKYFWGSIIIISFSDGKKLQPQRISMILRYNFRTLLLSLSLLLLPFSLLAQQGPASTNQQETIDTILKATNLAGSIGATPKEIGSQFASNPLGLEPAKNEKMIKLFREAYGDSLMVHVRQTFTEQYDSDYAAAASQWLQQEPAQRVMTAEEDYYSLQGTRKRVVRQYEMEQDPPSEERQEVIESLLEKTGATDSALESQLIIFRSIISAFSVLSEQQNLSDTQIDGIVNNYRFQIEPQLEQELSRQLMIMYYELDNDVLRQYSDFYETEAGKWLKATSDESVQSAYRAAADRFVESVGGSE